MTFDLHVTCCSLCVKLIWADQIQRLLHDIWPDLNEKRVRKIPVALLCHSYHHRGFIVTEAQPWSWQVLVGRCNAIKPVCRPPPPFLFPLTSLTSLKRKFWPADTSAVTWKWSLCVCVCLFECVKWAGFPSQINALCDVAGGRFLSACCLTQPVCLPVASDQLNELWCPVLFSNPLEPVCLQPPPLCTRTHADQQRHEHSHSQTSETTAAPGFFLSPKRSNVEHVRTTKFTKWHFHRFIRGEWVSPWTSRCSAINDHLQNWMLPCMNLCLDTD